MLEFLFEIVGEFLIQAILEFLIELGFHFAPRFRLPEKPWLLALGYILLGAIVGGVSLLIIPFHLVESEAWRIVNLAVTPLAVGFCMAAIGAWRAKRGQEVLRIDRFLYGYLFALAFALVRYAFATS